MATALGAIPGSMHATDYYVSESLGNDSWTGLLAEPNPGLTDGPKQSLGAAATLLDDVAVPGDRVLLLGLVHHSHASSAQLAEDLVARHSRQRGLAGADSLQALGIQHEFRSYAGGHMNQLYSRYQIALPFLPGAS